jgi:hypothetical protein
MRRFLLSLAAVAGLVSATSLLPVAANAMTPGTASGIRSAVEETNVVEDVRYVCRHRSYSSRRVCWWEPGRRHFRPYRSYDRPRFHRPHRSYRGW